jgi:hypothetical protein
MKAVKEKGEGRKEVNEGSAVNEGSEVKERRKKRKKERE